MIFDRIILCTDAPKGQGLAYYYFRALCDVVGTDKVRIVDEENRQYQANILKRGVRRIKYEFGHLSEQRYSRLVDQLVAGKNLVILFNNGDLGIREVQKLADNLSIHLVNYLSDSPFGIIPSRQKEALDSIPYFDLVCTFAKDLIPVIYQLGAQRVERIPFGYCKYTHLEPAHDVQIEFPSRVFYFGTWTPEIEKCVSPLLVFDLDIQGNGWENASQKKLRDIVARNNQNTTHPMAMMARKAGVVVNFTRARHGCFHTMKTFELTVAGACVVSNFSEEQSEFFPENHSMRYFNTRDEMLKLVNHLIDFPEEGLRIRENAIKDAFVHSYHERVHSLFSIL